ncbi:MAG: hypothetical protein A2Y23_15575 [Clostridiales bacterium GWB2_37_7]|nr:MAG: hypothetical protein A2Y23_15575 [Clostridiales bacterium GWB2_37_7]
MKRTKVLALVLAAAVMMMGAGYAYWTETITINGTVDTGILDVDIENEATVTYSDFAGTVVDNTYATGSIAPIVADGTSTANNDNDPARTVIFTNLYPNSKAVASFDIVNKSTMPVKMYEPLFYLVGDQQTLVASGDIDVYVLITDEDGNIGEYELKANETPIDLTNPRDGDAITNSLDLNEEFNVQIVLEVDPDLANKEDVSNLTFQFKPEFRQFNDGR